MPGFVSWFLGLLQRDGHRRHFVARRRPRVGGLRRNNHRTPSRSDGRRYGAGRYIGRRHGAGGYRGRRHGPGGFRGPRRHQPNGAGRSALPVQAAAPAAPAQNLVPVEAAVPPEADITIIDDEENEAAALPSPTPAVVEVAGDALAHVSAPTGASIFTFGSGVRSFTSAAFADAVVPPLLLSPTPATPPPSPRSSARHRLVALGLPLHGPPSSSHGHCAGAWSPTALGLANGVAPENRFPGNSSVEDARGGSGARR